MKIALVCGDGLPVSGLLTVFRNVLDSPPGRQLVERPVPADLGYSWRPDKPAFYPDGGPAPAHPDWLAVSTGPAVADPAAHAAELTALRDLVAVADSLDDTARAALHQRIETAAAPYQRYFADWFERQGADWVVAVNMTLSDAVPVTLALHRAAAERWAGRPGRLVFWDHDLLGSYAVHEGDHRVYPVAPNEFTPLPGSAPGHRWAVVSEPLAKEAVGYPTPLAPEYLPNPLPTVPAGMELRHHAFLDRIGAGPDRPVLLCPVRVFRVKGVEISVALHAAVVRSARERGVPVPLLLVFGALGEDPEYTEEVLAAVAAHGLAPDVRFLDGVPLSSRHDATGHWCPDEIDLLRICAGTGGGVLFTPNRPDVESVGLGPALAALVKVPCASTAYQVLDEVYGPSFRQIRVDPADPASAGPAFAELLALRRSGDPATLAALDHNHEVVRRRFPDTPWHDLLHDLHRRLTQESTS
ncbi:hypothetical protein ACIRBX_26490 [Kitasatospora sp. NPDC096147]|uniref:hypothetical protein n=1 Tax=Kitasatospora sp. NPDC096147 TaxID=3364093 RepID=UPI0037FE0FB6